MDVIFETQRGKAFYIEVGFFDTVLEIKEKVQKYKGIPVHTQTLIFNGHVLQEERDVEYCEILQNSRIQLLVAPALEIENNRRPSLSPLKEVQLNVNTPSSETSFPLEVDEYDIKPFLLLMPSCMVHSGKGSPTAAAVTGAATDTRGSQKMKLWVLLMYGTKKIPVAMNANDNVGELRKELQKLRKTLPFDLSRQGYFLVHKQNLMEEDRSFKWHQVLQGDTIEIFTDGPCD
ncbi:Polyubiquitin 10 [Hibiscus syriacus]|uniref:Polyubiquitin 10 n=1 Tax=Hibiscus syriacus TaxID=106335 RepID=A0A6A2ZXX7_HIBSY|nr:Polyubiquitin 10 [Hibiscus syriacus]